MRQECYVVYAEGMIGTPYMHFENVAIYNDQS